MQRDGCRSDIQANQTRSRFGISGHPGRNPVSQNLILGCIRRKTSATFMRHVHRRFTKQQTFVRDQHIHPPRRQLPRERDKIGLRILPAQRQLQPTLAVLVSVTRAKTATGPRQDRHHVIAKRRKTGIPCGLCSIRRDNHRLVEQQQNDQCRATATQRHGNSHQRRQVAHRTRSGEPG